jgi:uncharacterized LabA/DUF88 family protein
MSFDPLVKRTAAFVDGQNLFFAAKEAFGYSFPNYDPRALASAVCASQRWQLEATYFYNGVPDARDSARWNHFWIAKLAVMGTRGVRTFGRPLRYRDRTITLPSGEVASIRVGQEKGVDVRLALDVVRLARQKAFDVALLFNQDQDLSEVADELRAIARDQQRWIKVASAFPSSPDALNRRGVNKTDWIPIERTAYDACIDPNDYRWRTIG